MEFIVEGTGQYLTVDNNNIEANSEYNIKLSEEGGDVKATSNWWGTTDKSAISQKIYDSNRDFNLGTVNFEPFLTAKNTQAVPNENAPVPTVQSTVSPTPNQTIQPTNTPTATPSATAIPATTQTPTQPNTDKPIFGSFELELGIFAALIAVIVLLAVLIGLVLKRRPLQR